MEQVGIYIIGNTNAAQILFGFLSEDQRYQVKGFAVDSEYISEPSMLGLDVVSIESLIEKGEYNSNRLMMGIGYKSCNKIRESIFQRLDSLGFIFETYVHPSAVVSSKASIGRGCVILPNSVVEPFSRIDDNTYVCSNCTVAHHSVIGAHVWMASNSIISGEAVVGDNTFVGVGTTIVNKIKVGKMNIIGAGCLITKDTGDMDVYLSRNSEKHRFNSSDYSTYFMKD